jgi:hypothetical protein
MPKFPCLLGKFELVRVTSVIFYLYEEMEICFVMYEEKVSQDLTLHAIPIRKIFASEHFFSICDKRKC